MNLMRFRPRVRDVRLPDGRLVKVMVNDAHTTQHVEDGDRMHGTARPPAVRMSLRKAREPRVRQQFVYQDEIGLWAPVPDKETRP